MIINCCAGLVPHFVWDIIPVLQCSPRYRYPHNSLCISGGNFVALIRLGAWVDVGVFPPVARLIMPHYRHAEERLLR